MTLNSKKYELCIECGLSEVCNYSDIDDCPKHIHEKNQMEISKFIVEIKKYGWEFDKNGNYSTIFKKGSNKLFIPFAKSREFEYEMKLVKERFRMTKKHPELNLDACRGCTTTQCPYDSNHYWCPTYKLNIIMEFTDTIKRNGWKFHEKMKDSSKIYTKTFVHDEIEVIIVPHSLDENFRLKMVVAQNKFKKYNSLEAELNEKTVIYPRPKKMREDFKELIHTIVRSEKEEKEEKEETFDFHTWGKTRKKLKISNENNMFQSKTFEERLTLLEKKQNTDHFEIGLLKEQLQEKEQKETELLLKIQILEKNKGQRIKNEEKQHKQRKIKEKWENDWDNIRDILTAIFIYLVVFLTISLTMIAFGMESFGWEYSIKYGFKIAILSENDNRIVMGVSSFIGIVIAVYFLWQDSYDWFECILFTIAFTTCFLGPILIYFGSC